MKNIFIILLLLGSMVGQGQVKQRSALKGFNGAIQLHSLGWTSEYFKFLDEGASSGYGGGFRVGYGITELIEPYIGFDFTKMIIGSNIEAESFKMTHFDMGVRFNFAGTVHRFRPFAEGGYSLLKGTVKQVSTQTGNADLIFKGGKPHLGGGIGFFPKIPISIFAKGIFTLGKKSTATLDGVELTDKPDVTTFRITVGVNFNISELTKN